MALTITSNLNTITLDWGTYSETLSKEDIQVTVNGDYVTISTEQVSHKILYSTVTTPTYASAALMEAGLISMIDDTGSQSQVFTATSGQATFDCVFTCVSGITYVYVNGVAQVSGWSVVGGNVVFSPALVGGEEVLIVIS